MIKENLVAERIAIQTYREMVNFFGDKDPTSRVMMEAILAQEEEHADDMADLFSPSNRMTSKRKKILHLDDEVAEKSETENDQKCDKVNAPQAQKPDTKKSTAKKSASGKKAAKKK